MNILEIYLNFWIFAVLGWIMEIIVCSFGEKKIVNRGFLIGPYCPIYGFGASIMLLFIPYKDDPFTCFVLSLFTCSILEYFTSYLMEKMFKIRWWDYSSDTFNINGRVCLRNALAFGALGVIFTRYLYPVVSNLFTMLNDSTVLVLSIIVLIITTVDIIVSFKAMDSVKNIVRKNISEWQNKDATLDIKKLIHDKIIHTNFFERRLLRTYHLLEEKHENLKNKIESLSKGSGYGVVLSSIIFGIIAGLILSYVFKLGHYSIIIPISISLCTLISSFVLKVRGK